MIIIKYCNLNEIKPNESLWGKLRFTVTKERDTVITIYLIYV